VFHRPGNDSPLTSSARTDLVENLCALCETSAVGLWPSSTDARAKIPRPAVRRKARVAERYRSEHPTRSIRQSGADFGHVGQGDLVSAASRWPARLEGNHDKGANLAF
jgi:hypothetical protein